MSGAAYWRTLIGEEAWNQLTSWQGGRDFDIPTSIDSSSGRCLALRIGQDAASKLIQEAGGDRLYIAAGWEEELMQRYREVKKMYTDGMTIEEISRCYRYEGRYTPRHVRSIVHSRCEAMARIVEPEKA